MASKPAARRRQGAAPRCASCSRTAASIAAAGQLLFTDLTVDASSGQVTLRAEVPNPDGLLLPGQYVRVRLAQAELPAAMLLPQQAVTRSNQGDTVLVVGADGSAGQAPGQARRQARTTSGSCSTA